MRKNRGPRTEPRFTSIIHHILKPTLQITPQQPKHLPSHSIKFQFCQEDPVIHPVERLSEVYKYPLGKAALLLFQAPLTLSTISWTAIAMECPALNPYCPGLITPCAFINTNSLAYRTLSNTWDSTGFDDARGNLIITHPLMWVQGPT
jgi:hypothetical protein